MAEEHLFTADVTGPGASSDRRSRWQSCLIGCLVVIVVALLLLALIGYWISRNWRNMTATWGTEMIRQVMAQSHLPPQEQQEIMVQVDRVAQAFRENRISVDQGERLAGILTQTPVLSLIELSMIEHHYFAKSGLSAEEKSAGRQTLQRFIRGALDDQIGPAGVNATMVHVAYRHDPGPDHQWTLRDKLTDDELRAFFAEAKQQADAAKIPDQPADVDPSEEIKKIVDATLAAPG